MAYTAKALIPGSTLTTAAAVYYTVPPGVNTRITQFSLTNTDAVARTVSVYLVDNAAAPTAADTLIKDKTLAAGETWVPYQALGAVLSPGGTIQLIADAVSVVTVKASGLELT